MKERLMARIKRDISDPQLGLIDPNKPTSVVDFTIDKDTQKFLNKVSKLSNHTISSVITIMLTIQLVHAKEALKKGK